MRRLAQLFAELDSTTSTNNKVEALARYFDDTPDEDKIWVITILSGRKPPRAITYKLMSQWAAEMAGIPEWLFIESYHIVGDYAETIALVIPDGSDAEGSSQSLDYYMRLLLHLKSKDEADKKRIITDVWKKLNQHERFIFNKMITGGLRVGISQKLMIRALSMHTGMGEQRLTARLMGNWDPAEISFADLIEKENNEADLSRPYPFCLAYPLDIPTEDLDSTENWLIERKWDGIRGQLILRAGKLYIWTRGEELVTERYPELHPLVSLLPNGTVLDCELLVFRDGRPRPFQEMQKRIGRKSITKKLMQDLPVRAIVFDVLEWGAKDIRNMAQQDRRNILEAIFREHILDGMLILSDLVNEKSWESLNRLRLVSRDNDCEGLMLKHSNATYEVGRKRGNWWKWKTDPFSVDCVMIYAQRGHGRRANMFTDFTFAVRDGDMLVAFAKAYSGLTDAEFEEITNWVNQNTIERFGPVNVVSPVHVFELHFEGIGHSSRHKSGVAVRFPRIHRWRKDKNPEEVGTLDDLKKLIHI